MDLLDENTLRYKLFPSSEFYKIQLYFSCRMKYYKINKKLEFGVL